RHITRSAPGCRSIRGHGHPRCRCPGPAATPQTGESARFFPGQRLDKRDRGTQTSRSLVRHDNTAFRRRRLLAIAERRVREASADAAGTAELINGLRAPFNDALGLSGMLLSATDPHTTALGTATVVEH